MTRAYYNECDPYAAQWLLNLIDAGQIALGDVDEREIQDVRPSDLAGYTQCHFFAGIGVWSYALRLAQWPDTRPVWTGSCPCQPFSVAGRGDGMRDDRHLWPYWHWLISQCRPPVIFGEQVEAAIRHGWLDLVSSDLEGLGYAVGSSGLPAACIGAPHIRQRLWFVAESYHGGFATSSRLKFHDEEHNTESCGQLGNTSGPRLAQRIGERKIPPAAPDGTKGRTVERASAWSDAAWLPCRDGKARPVEPGTFPLAHGAAARVGRLRAYGNAIVPQVAAEVIRAYMDCGL